MVGLTTVVCNKSSVNKGVYNLLLCASWYYNDDKEIRRHKGAPVYMFTSQWTLTLKKLGFLHFLPGIEAGINGLQVLKFWFKITQSSYWHLDFKPGHWTSHLTLILQQNFWPKSQCSRKISCNLHISQESHHLSLKVSSCFLVLILYLTPI